MSRPSAGGPVSPELELVDAIERAGIDGWPPTAVRWLADGWVLRATPGLDRGRSNNALTPRTRSLEDGELPVALGRVRAWSALHGIRGGLQVTPLELHAHVVPGLLSSGWEPVFRVWVMVADRLEALARADGLPRAGSDELTWTCSRTAEPAWLEAWAACRESRAGIDLHASTVFRNMADRGRFVRGGDLATGIAVEDADGEWAGLFSLVVKPGQRGRGLGRQLLVALLRSVSASRIYLQVEMSNTVALRLYESFGFRTSHSYQHLHAPVGWATG